MDDPAEPRRLVNTPPPGKNRRIDLDSVDSESAEESEYHTDEDDDYETDSSRMNPTVTPRAHTLRPTLTLAPNRRLQLLTDYHQENQLYTTLHELVTAFDRIRPIWFYQIPPRLDVAPVSSFVRRTPTARELAAQDMGPAVTAMAGRAEMLDLLVAEVAQSYRVMLRFVTDVQTGTVDHATLGRLVEVQYARGVLPFTAASSASESEDEEDNSSEIQESPSPEPVDPSPVVWSFSPMAFPPSQQEPHLMDESYDEDDEALCQLPTIAQGRRMSTPVLPIAPDVSPSGQMPLSEVNRSLERLDERRKRAMDEFNHWCESVSRPHTSAFKKWVDDMRTALQSRNQSYFDYLIYCLEIGDLNMSHAYLSNAKLMSIWERTGHDVQRPDALRSPTPRVGGSPGPLRLSLSPPPPPLQFLDSGGWLDYPPWPAPLGTMPPAVLPGPWPSRVGPQWSVSSPNHLTWETSAPAQHVPGSSAHHGPTRPVIALKPDEIQTWGASNHYEPSIASSTSSASTTPTTIPPRYFDTAPVANPEPLRPATNMLGQVGAPLPHSTAGITIAPLPVPVPDAPRSTARNIIYGPAVNLETPEQFRARHAFNLKASEAFAAYVLRKQAAAEREEELRASTRQEPAGASVGQAPRVRQKLEDNASATSLLAQPPVVESTIDDPAPSRIPAPKPIGEGPKEIVRSLPGGTHESYTPAPGHSGWGGVRPIQPAHDLPSTRHLPAVRPNPEAESVETRRRPQMSRVVGAAVPPRSSSSPPERTSATRYTPAAPVARPALDISRESRSQSEAPRRRFWDARDAKDRSPIKAHKPPEPLSKEMMVDDGTRPPYPAQFWAVGQPRPVPRTGSNINEKKRPASPDTAEPPAKRKSTLSPKPGPARRLAVSGRGPYSSARSLELDSAPQSGPSTERASVPIINPLTRPQVDQRSPPSPQQRVPNIDHMPAGDRVPSTDRLIPGDRDNGKGKAYTKDKKPTLLEQTKAAPAVAKIVSAAPVARSRRSTAPLAPSAGMAPGARRRRPGPSTIIDVGRTADPFQPPEALPFCPTTARQLPVTSGGRSTSSGGTPRPTIPFPGPVDPSNGAGPVDPSNGAGLTRTGTRSRANSATPALPPPVEAAAFESPLKRRSSTRIKERDSKRQRTEEERVPRTEESRTEEPDQPVAGPNRRRRTSFISKISDAAKEAVKKMGKKDYKHKRM
ncbi:hypothetical protein CspHIS471_0200160 [Cutaneotrichosporon sp. HIS471]|nr:hypothetical protein CspHIS471_0200160 [Cutaneotrichosporon sp. HIS471]